MIVTLCGSVKFKDRFDYWNAELSKQGISVFSVGVAEKGLKPSIKCQLDIVHFEKIRISNLILVMDEDNYIGESTVREIYYAKSHNIPVVFVSKFKETKIDINAWLKTRIHYNNIVTSELRAIELINAYNERTELNN